MKKRILTTIMAMLMIVTCLLSPAMASPADPQTSGSQNMMAPVSYETVNGQTVEANQEKDNTDVEILVAVEDGETVFLQTSDLELAVASADEQQAVLRTAQNSIESALGMTIQVEHYYSLVFNGFAFRGEVWMLDAINAIEGLTAMEAPMYELVEPEQEEAVNLTPAMSTATNMVGADLAWDLGYTGKGMVVAIIDTGIKQTHEAFSVAPEGAKIDQAYLDNIFSQYGNLMHCKNDEGAYYSAKMPYNWDYFDHDSTPNHTANNHGSHVAGIVAGNNGDDFKGIAPDAQIISLQVFTNTGGAYITDLLSAMEDCVYLGVDAVNMSLGVANGFVTYEWPMNYGPVYEALEKAGIAVCVAAGNDQHAYISNNYGDWGTYVWQWLSTNPDSGLIGSPGTYNGSFTVGNAANVARTGDGCSILYKDTALEVKPTLATTSGQLFFDVLAAGTYDLVNVGTCSVDEIAAAGDVTGKILLSQKTGYSTRIKNAIAAGAIGVIFYDHNGTGTATFNPSSKVIPVGIISQADGEAIIADMGSGNVVQITLKTGSTVDYSKVTMVDSSSWGPTSQLTMKPEISAPGQSIVSVDGTGSAATDAYSKKTGTSMATPAVAGGVLLMKEYLKTVFPQATGRELYEMSYALMMSTAGHANAFVRKQGAGVMDLEKAMKTKAYLTTAGGKRPKLELDDSENGEFAISFQIHNFGTVERTYQISHTALTEQTFQYAYTGWHEKDGQAYAKFNGTYIVLDKPVNVWLMDNTIKDVTDWCTLEGEKTVKVPAGQSVTVNLTLKAGEELKAYFAETCPDGMYLEGWINLTDTTAENAVDLSIPYLGFVGDWDYPAVIDIGWWWQTPYGVDNMAQFYGSNRGGGIYAGFDALEQGLGLNPYWDEKGETYLADRNAISPDGDGYLDAVNNLEFSLLRQPKTVKAYLRNESGEVVHEIYNKSYSFRRETHPVSIRYSDNLTYSYIYFDGIDYTKQEENENLTLVLEAWLDHEEFRLGDNKQAKVEIPFTIDTTAPVVTAVDGGVEIQDTNYVAYYAIYSDARHTDLVFEDGVFAMERGAKEIYKTDLKEYFVAVADYAHNEAFYYVEDGVAYALDGEGFDHGRTIIAQSHYNMTNFDGTNYDAEGCLGFAWYALSDDLQQSPIRLTDITLEKDDEIEADIMTVAKTADGTAYASSLYYLYRFDPATQKVDRENKLRYWEEGNPYPPVNVRFFMAAPGTNKLYGFAQLDTKPWDYYAVSINPETGEMTRLGWTIDKTFYGQLCMKDEDTVLALRSFNRYFDEINVETGKVENTINTSLASRRGRSEFGFRGWTSPMIYDAQENRVFVGGAWSIFTGARFEQGGIVMYDFDTATVDYFQPGNGKGIAMFGLYFLDEFVNIPEQEHITYIKEVVEGDCLTEGYTLRVCAECGKEFKENITEAKGHDYEAVVTAPTCTTLGYTTYTCANCGDSYKDDYTPNTDHEYGEWETVTAPTCNAKGQEKRTCVCGAAQYRDTAKTGHNYKAEVTAPTCTTLGYTTYTCIVCGDTYKSDFVETIGHKYTEEVVAPTCTDMGYTIFTCHCGYRYEGNFVAPTGHKFGEWTVTKEATCTAYGEETRTCACGETETRATPKADHVFEDVVTAPTCTEVGYTNHVCTVCGHNYITDLTQPTGHDYEATVTAPTCTEDGYTTYTCTVCGESYVDDIVPATGHTFGEWVLTTEPGCTEAGEETRYCTDCDATETREVAPVCPAEKFSDVDTKQWYHEGVCYVIRNGLMNGKSETIFAPNANLTRAELVTVLYRMAGEPSVEDLEHPFADVADDTWYTDAVIWAYNAEVVKGISNTAFAPNANITREQIAAILYRYAGAEAVEEDSLKDFVDADKVNAYAVEAMNWAVSVGLINGMDDATLAPQGNATRAQIATILMRYCEG